MMKKVIALVSPFRKKAKKVEKVIVLALTNEWSKNGGSAKISFLQRNLPSHIIL
jgi:hypothetical protein